MKMKYIVTLKKALEKRVVVDAVDLEELEKKLVSGDFIFTTERSISLDTYAGWEYKPQITGNTDINCLPVDNGDDIICNIEDFARWYGCSSVEDLERSLFKYTECGMCYSSAPDSITLVGYVEGADCEHPNETLLYPFTGQQVREVMTRLEVEANRMWHEWNDVDEDE